MRIEESIERCKIGKKGIIHIGAHEGEEANLYEEIGFSNVLWIEGDPIIFKKLERNIKAYPKQIAMNLLLSDKEDVVPFYIASNQGNSSSLLPFAENVEKAWPGIHSQKVINIVSKRLDSILLENEIRKNYNCLNIDVQGAELIVLKGIGALLPLFEFCLLELNFKPTYQSSAKFPVLNKYMYKNGFKLKFISIGKYQGEGVYVRLKKPYAKKIITLTILKSHIINIIAISGIIDFLKKTKFGDFVRLLKKRLVYKN
jgi:FkbM family methyltransferase